MTMRAPYLWRFRRMAGSAAILSLLLYAGMAVVGGREAWDVGPYLPVIAVTAFGLGFMAPKAVFLTATVFIALQIAGALLFGVFRNPENLAWWPVLFFLTLPLVVVPAVVPAAFLGAASSLALTWIRRVMVKARNHPSNPRQGGNL